MTTQEQQMLQGLTDRINNTQLAEKDPDAERYLQDTLGRNPDALYIMAQTLLVQQYALEQAQKQLADARNQIEGLRQQVQQPKHTGSFLGNLLGMNDEPSRPAAPPPPPAAQYNQPQYTPVPNYSAGQGYPPQYGAPQYGGPQSGYGAPQSGGFLRSAMQTATGVAAGALAFEGIESLMHGFGHSGGYGQGFGDFGGGSGRPEEIINNYYGDQGTSGLGSDVEDRRNDTPRFADTDNDQTGETSPGYGDDSPGQDDQPADFGSDDVGYDSSSNDDTSI